MTFIKQLSLVITLSLFSYTLMAQGWIRTYGSEMDDGGRDVVQTADGGYALTGTSNEDVFLVKTDLDGNVQWSQIYDNGSEETGHAVIASADGGFYILASYRVPGTSGNATNTDLWLIRVDEAGNVLWSETYGGISYENAKGLIELPGGNVLMLCTSLSFNDGTPYIVKVDNTGAVIWEQFFLPLEFPDWTYSDAADFVVDGEGNILVTGTHRAYEFFDEQIFLMKTDSNGAVLWYNRYGLDSGEEMNEDGRAILAAPDGSYYLAGERFGPDENNINFAYRPWLIKVDADGAISWEKLLNQEGLRTRDMTLMPNGDFMVVGSTDTPPYPENENIFVARFDSIGELLWRNTYGQTANDEVYNVISLPDGGIVIVGNKSQAFDTDLTDAMLMKMDGNGVIFSNAIGGEVSQDMNDNCEVDPGDYGLANWIVLAQGNQTFYGVTDVTGAYLIDVTPGTYQVQAFPPIPYWQACLPVNSVTIQNFGDSIMVNHPQEAIEDCPYLTVDISSAFLRRCFESKYHVDFCNEGTIPVEDAEVVVTLDSFLTVVSTSIPWSTVEGHTYTFGLGDLDIGQCGHFTIDVYVDCDNTVLGQSHCTEAHIYPDTSCIDPNLDWDGSSLIVDAICTGDSIEVNIQNIGDGDMSLPSSYLVVEDNVMLFHGNLQLGSGEDTLLVFEATGATLYFEVAQSDGHPGNSTPNVIIEGCGGFPFSIGYVPQYPENDGDHFISIDCQQNIGAFDPNDKIGYPIGRGTANLIDENQEIEYRIRFQNTGTDTAFNIYILDTLSSFLDLTSIRLGASSHPFEFDILDTNVLRFYFPDIMLPDSNINEPGSHGFVKFRIAQTPDNPIGIEIFNAAAIYFDFNEPVITNQTVHRIGQPLLVQVEPDLPLKDVPSLKVYPNPFSESAIFEYEDENARSLQLELYDFSGRLIRSESTLGNHLSFRRNNLAPGIYFYTFKSDGIQVGSGKVLVQE